MDRDGQWFDEWANPFVQLVGQWVERALGPGHELAQGAVRPSVTGKPDPEAQVLCLGDARLACPARNRGVHGDATPAHPTGLDDPVEFVAEHERRVEDRIADPAIDDPVAVRTAQPDATDPDQRLARTGLRDRLVVQAEPAIGGSRSASTRLLSAVGRLRTNRDPDPHRIGTAVRPGEVRDGRELDRRDRALRRGRCCVPSWRARPAMARGPSDRPSLARHRGRPCDDFEGDAGRQIRRLDAVHQWTSFECHGAADRIDPRVGGRDSRAPGRDRARACRRRSRCADR